MPITEASRRARWPLSTFDRLMSKVSPCPNTGCWFWAGSGTNGRGYGRTYFQGKNWQAHRAYYELLVGPIPEGLELDHKCRVTFCVNPEHLDPVPHRVNVQRGVTGAVNTRRQRSKTHCPRGHPYSGRNLYINPNGSRKCKTCNAAYGLRRR